MTLFFIPSDNGVHRRHCLTSHQPLPGTKQMVTGAPWWEDWRIAPSTWQEAGQRGPLCTMLLLSLSSPLWSATFEIWAHLFVLILSSREPSNKHFRYQLLRWPIFFRTWLVFPNVITRGYWTHTRSHGFTHGEPVDIQVCKGKGSNGRKAPFLENASKVMPGR